MADESYTVIANVQAHTGITYGVSSVPTATEVETFMNQRAGVIYGWIQSVLGDSAPAPKGYTNAIEGTNSDAEKGLAAVADRANAIGAAADALQAAGSTQSPQSSERVERLNEMFDAIGEGTLHDQIILAAEGLRADTGQSGTHVSGGDVTVPTVTAVEQQGLPFTSLTKW